MCDDADYLDGMDAFYPFDEHEWREHETAAHQEREAEWLAYIETGV